MGQLFFCVVSKVIRCSNKLSPWGRESTAKPGEGTRVVDYTPQSLHDSPPTLVGQFFCVVSQVIRCSNKLSP